MVKFPYTSTDPETMMVEFPNTLVAFLAMSTSVRLLDVANIAETFCWQYHWLNMPHAFDLGFF